MKATGRHVPSLYAAEQPGSLPVPMRKEHLLSLSLPEIAMRRT